MLKNFLKISVIVFAFLFVYACSEDDNPVSGGEDHADAIGMRIVSSGVTLVSYIGDEAVQGSITVEEGVLSAGMDIEFYNDESESWFTPEEAENSLGIEVADTTIAQYWQHEGEEGGFEFHIRGKQQGQTSVVFSILHDEHADFVSKAIPVVVAADE